MYRALALKALEQHVPLDDADALRRLAEDTDDPTRAAAATATACCSMGVTFRSAFARPT